MQPRWAPYLFIAPFFILFGIFFGLPTLRSLQLSFYTERGVDTSATFAGLDNYRTLLADPNFAKSLVNTSYYALGSLLIIVPLSLSLALLLRTKGLLLREFFRLSLFLPNAISGIVVAIVFRLVFDAGIRRPQQLAAGAARVAEAGLAGRSAVDHAQHHPARRLAVRRAERDLLHGRPAGSGSRNP